MGEQRNINTGGGDACEVHNQGQYSEGNIDNRRYQQGIIANDNATINIETLHQHFHFENPFPDGVPFKAPPIPKHFVPRPQYSNVIREQLLSVEANQPGTLVVSAIQGLGGIGKSVMAAALAHEPAIAKHFPNGVLWVTLGQKPDLLPLLGDWIFKLGDQQYKPTTVEAASDYLRSLLADKTMLLVVDDLWNASHFEPFRLAGKGCRVLVTTREVRLKDAQRIELAEMSLAESLALVEKRLDRQFDETEREEFAAFARAVGYLPLALELGAVQIEDGYYDWHTLLEAFEEEFDILDLEGDEISENDRRKYSLRACFNLSLKRLKPEQVRQFAWLGVLPEDVSVDARSVATLWETKPGATKKGLIGLHRRALLLAGVPVSVNGRSEPTFRQHDLLHDLAVELVAASPSAALPGLGLSMTVAHGQLLDRYRPASGAWWDLADDGYIHRRLTWHMERAGQIREMHELIRSANGAGRNAWSEACEDLGLLTVFVEDVARAWRCAEEVYGVIPTQAEGWWWQFWCAFAMGSLNSLVGNIPGELLATAVRQGHWSEARAVAYALQKREEGKRSKALAALMPELRGREIVDEAIRVARGMVSAENRDRVFVAVIEHQAEYWSPSNAITVVCQLSTSHEQSRGVQILVKKVPQNLKLALWSIADQIPKKLDKIKAMSEISMEISLKLLQQLSNEADQVRALDFIASRIPSKLLPKVLSIVKTMSFDHSISRSLIILSHYFQGNLLEEAVSIACRISSEIDRTDALVALCNYLPQQYQSQILKIAISTIHPLNKSKLILASAKWQESLFSEALQMTRRYLNRSAQVEILSRLSERDASLFNEALEVLEKIPNEYHKTRIFEALLEKLPTSFLPKALSVVLRVEHEKCRAMSLRVMAEKFNSCISSELSNAARQLLENSDKAFVFTVLAEKDSSLFYEALILNTRINDDLDKAKTLVELTFQKSAFLSEALIAIRNISDHHGDCLYLSERAHLMARLVSLQPSLLPEALRLIDKISDDHCKYTVLAELVGNIPVWLFHTAAIIAKKIPHKLTRAKAFLALSKHRKECFLEALTITRQNLEASERARMLGELAIHQEDLFAEALVAASEIPSVVSQVSVLCQLCQMLPQKYFSQALNMARQISVSERAEVLNVLVKYDSSLMREALELTLQIDNDHRRSSALVKLAENLPVSLHSRMLEVIGLISSCSERAKVLSTLANFSSLQPSVDLRQSAIAIRDPYHRAQALTGFTDPTSWQTIHTDHNQNLLRLLSTRDRKHLIELLPKLHPTLLQLGGQPAIDAAIEAMRDACNQWP